MFIVCTSIQVMTYTDVYVVMTYLLAIIIRTLTDDIFFVVDQIWLVFEAEVNSTIAHYKK